MLEPAVLSTAAAVAGLLAAIVVGWWMIARSRSAAHGLDADEPEDLLDSLRAAYEAGQMDEAEFERVRRSLEGGPSPGRASAARSTPPQDEGDRSRPGTPTAAP